MQHGPNTLLVIISLTISRDRALGFVLGLDDSVGIS